MGKKRKISAEEAVSMALSLHRSGRIKEAESIYSQIVQLLPKQADALHYLGVLRHRQGRSDEAVALIQRAVASAPGYADAYNNLGNVLKELGRLTEAADAYRRVLSMSPDHADACNNLGVVLKNARRPLEAEAAFRRSIQIDAKNPGARRNLANLLRRSGKLEDALEQYRLLLVEEPGDPVLEYLIQVCDTEQSPSRAPDGYVRAEFDACADEFDEKLSALSYRAPQLVDAALSRALSAQHRDLNVLDAGCGTGLCGPLLRPRARLLVGVDLSDGMLEKARSRGTYDELYAEELTGYLRRHGAVFDLIVSADTLCYFGALEAVLDATARALRPGGYLAFTTEQQEGTTQPDSYRLKPSGRYGHGGSYLRSVLTASGLDILTMEAKTLRMEGGNPVTGHLVLATLRGPR